MLAVQTLILPRFQLIRSVNNSTNGNAKWGITLTIYGHTFHKEQTFDSAMEAKVIVCQDALEVLKRQIPQLCVPSEPSDCPTAMSTDWNWAEILHGE